jgi:hypothetical protein
MTNNELSRKVLEALLKNSGKIRFKELVETFGEDARVIFKNLFFLEEKTYVQLSTSYPSDSVYPTIHIIKLRKEGEKLAEDHEEMSREFPLSDKTTDSALNIPPNLNGNKKVTFANVLELLASKIRKEMDDDDRNSALNKIEYLLRMDVVNCPIEKD